MPDAPLDPAAIRAYCTAPSKSWENLFAELHFAAKARVDLLRCADVIEALRAVLLDMVPGPTKEWVMVEPAKVEAALALVKGA